VLADRLKQLNVCVPVAQRPKRTLAFFTIQCLGCALGEEEYMQSGVKRPVRDKTESATDGQFVIVCTGPSGKEESLYKKS
jgi:hypothetical protein